MEKLIKKIKKSSSISEMENVHNEIVAFFETATEQDKQAIREAFELKSKHLQKQVTETKNKAEALLKEIEADIFIEKEGIRYNLKEWLTPSEYAKKYTINTAQIVSNWITRGIIPPENVLKINRLNIQLVKDIRYK